jgi:hypothetical protein
MFKVGLGTGNGGRPLPRRTWAAAQNDATACGSFGS